METSMTGANLKEMATLTAHAVRWQNYKALTWNYQKVQKYSDFGPNHDLYYSDSTHFIGSFQFQKKFILRFLHVSPSL